MSTLKMLAFGLCLGTAFGAWNLYETWRDPLADDSVLALLAFYGPMFLAWTSVGFIRRRSGGTVGQAAMSATVFAFATFTSYFGAQLVRVNLFLEQLRERDDWQFMMSRFAASGSDHFRSYINHIYVAGAPFKILVATAIGFAVGLAGAGIASLWTPRGNPM